VIQERTLFAGLLLCNDTEQYGHSWRMRALVDKRPISPERNLLLVCCVSATDGNRKKERGCYVVLPYA
jgi:hypothetical protein